MGYEGLGPRDAPVEWKFKDIILTFESIIKI